MERHLEHKASWRRGFTLIETLAAIALLMVAIVAPMSLATQSLSAAYYARDQITGFYLAQEGIEVVRSVRDSNILKIADGQTGVQIFDNICPTEAQCVSGYTFTVNSTLGPSNAIEPCASSGCPPLQTDGTVYGYDPDCPWPTSDCGSDPSAGWTDTTYTRTVTAQLMEYGGTPDPDELRITSTVTWTQGNYQIHSFSLNEDLYNWVPQ